MEKVFAKALPYKVVERKEIPQEVQQFLGIITTAVSQEDLVNRLRAMPLGWWEKVKNWFQENTWWISLLAEILW